MRRRASRRPFAVCPLVGLVRLLVLRTSRNQKVGGSGPRKRRTGGGGNLSPSRDSRGFAKMTTSEKSPWKRTTVAAERDVEPLNCGPPIPTAWPQVQAPFDPFPARRPKPRPLLYFRRPMPLARHPQSMVKRWAYRIRQRSFNWQSTAFVMRGLSVRLRPLALGRSR